MYAFRFVLASLAVTLMTASVAEAQYRRGRVVRSPGVGVTVSPYGMSVRSPYGGFSYRGSIPYYYGPRYGVRSGYPVPNFRGSVTARTQPTGSQTAGTRPNGTQPNGVSPTPASTQPTAATEAPLWSPTESGVAVTTAKPTIMTGTISEAQLAAMNADQLQGALTNAATSLDAKLASFQGGDGWQKYLALPGDLASDVSKLEQLLRRFDSVARDAQFARIASLPEFTTMRTALRIAVDRGALGDAPVLTPPPLDSSSRGEPAETNEATETLPVPQADTQPTPTENGDTTEEHSVLKR